MKKKILVMFYVVFYLNTAYAQQIWKELKIEKNLQQKKQLYFVDELPKSYKLFSFNKDYFLNKTLQSKSTTKAVVKLPDENGVLSDFYIQKTQNFHVDLAKKFPGIQSFKAVKKLNNKVVARISMGSNGFNAVISSSNKRKVFIKPLFKDKSKYIVYTKENLTKKKEDFDCKVFGLKKIKKKLSTSKRASDGLLRTYRIAIVASAEYSQFYLNREGVSASASLEIKKETVLSALNTSLTRINEIFERELSVNFSLVGDNDKIIFFDTNTDGITNGAVFEMIEECQVICDREIGFLNYDIGHVVSQGSENTGLASSGSVCLNGQKARAVTSKISPFGDTFDVDFFAHEIGHQFGATHTYNNSCSNNRNDATAFEPGSGSTIMSYAGICSPNVQPQVDDYFHTTSLSQMLGVIQSSATCASTVVNNNTAPAVNAGLDYFIPKRTPFVLTGDATDLENQSNLSYVWEQVDNQIVTMPPVSTSSQGPTFRSVPPTSSSKRYFPNLEDLVAGNFNEWEVLPSVARSLNFVLTVRDNNEFGGSFSKDNTVVNIVETEAFSITSQNVEEIWDAGSTQTVTWNVGTTNQSPINTQFVTIKLSLDGGRTFPINLVENTLNDGEESFVVPENISNNVRIMVSADDNIYFDINNVDLEIKSTIPTFIFTVDENSKFACNLGNDSAIFQLSLDFINDFSETVTLSSSGAPLGATVNFSTSTVNEDGVVTVTLSNLNGIAAQNYPITFTGSSSNVIRNVDVNLFVTENIDNSVNLTLPENNAEDVPVAAGFTWEANPNASFYTIEIANDDNFNNIVTQANTTINAFTAFNLVKGVRYFWRVKPVNTCSEGVFSSVFTFMTEFCRVCDSEGSTQFDTSTTFVGFNTIANETLDKVSAYSDFTAISTTVAKDAVYDLVVNANTADDSNNIYTTRTTVWIDWNQNCNFNEAGEVYDLGVTTGSRNGQTSLSPLKVRVPADAVLGNTIMRVTTKFENEGAPSSCEIGADAEVEDYTINVDTTASSGVVNFDDFEMYPNPTKNSLTIRVNIENKNSKLKIQIIDLTGRLVEEQSFENLENVFFKTINLTEKNSALYFVRLINGNNVLVKRLMIR